MSIITKQWLQQTISEMEEHRDLFPGDLDDNHEKVLSAMRVALASLEAEPAIHRWRRVTVEPYGPYPWHYGNFIGFSKPVEGIEDEYYYSAPPAPVSVPAAMEMDDDFDSAFEHGKAVGWNAYRAAMLQGAKPVTTAYKLRDAVETIRNSGIVIDADKIFAERDALNSPVIPDGWVMVPEEPTHEMLEAGDEQFGTYDVYRRMIAAAPQQEAKNV
ncbi:hypothetical protein [Enterobacter mori]|uniref:hypothetical protein n=1 Tax=Enterobacter mori TaxID=539813 RepID=UPI003076778A